MGAYQPATGQSVCIDCPVGYYSAVNESSQCTACAAGSISTSEASTKCIYCPTGYYQGTTSQSVCIACTAGTYVSEEGSASCTDCPGNFFSSAAGTKCSKCIKEYYYSLDGECELCPTGTSCSSDGGSAQEDIELLKGYWRISPTSIEIFRCPFKGACVGGSNVSDRGDSYCADGFQGAITAGYITNC